MTRQLLQQALDALTLSTTPVFENIPTVLAAMKAITTALAQPEPEPVAWMDDHGRVESAVVKSWASSQMAASYNIPLYAAPPAPDSEQLRKELDSMTVQRDAWLIGYQNLLNKTDADRLDAQRWRYFVEYAFVQPMPKDFQGVSNTTELTAAIDAAMKGNV